jgi:hypothetical protein
MTDSSDGTELPHDHEVETAQGPDVAEDAPAPRRQFGIIHWPAFFIMLFVGLAILLAVTWISAAGILPSQPSGATGPSAVSPLVAQVNPPSGYPLPAVYGELGPQLLAAGAIDYDRFVQLYAQGPHPLTEKQLAILKIGSQDRIMINSDNAQFLLNLFWAFGLANQNAVLTDGPMMSRGKEQVGNFASTGGWTLGAKPATELYASALIVALTPEQQARVEAVASGVYRPCCDNATLFPDCNHGMAMLGLLELMASQGASENQMFVAAKYVNAFWFPQQTLELATLFKATQNTDFAQTDARELVGRRYSSSSGFRAAHEMLAKQGLLEQAPGQGGSCGVK